jgi:hypothetical protein
MATQLSNKTYCANYAAAAFDEAQLYLTNNQDRPLAQTSQNNAINYRPHVSFYIQQQKGSHLFSSFRNLSPRFLQQCYQAQQNSLKMYTLFAEMKDSEKDWLKMNLVTIAHHQISIDTLRINRTLHYGLVALGILAGFLAYTTGKIFRVHFLTQFGFFTLPYAVIGPAIAFVIHRSDESEIRRNYISIGEHNQERHGLAYRVLYANLPKYDGDLNYSPPKKQSQPSTSGPKPPSSAPIALSNTWISGAGEPPLQVDNRGIPVPIPATMLYQGIPIPTPSAPFNYA